jgi:hypothetical protein
MQRDYPEWDIDDDTAEIVDRSVRDEIYRDVPPGTDSVASEEQVGRQELTARLAGTRDKSSRAWKTARDTLTRYRSGRRAVGPRNAARIRAATEAARRDSIRAARRAHVEITAGWTTSRTRWLGKPVADLTGEDLTDFLAAIEEGDTLGAIQIVADVYGLDPEFVLEIDADNGFDISILADAVQDDSNGEASEGRARE